MSLKIVDFILLIPNYAMKFARSNLKVPQLWFIFVQFSHLSFAIKGDGNFQDH